MATCTWCLFRLQGRNTYRYNCVRHRVRVRVTKSAFSNVPSALVSLPSRVCVSGPLADSRARGLGLWLHAVVGLFVEKGKTTHEWRFVVFSLYLEMS